MASKQNSEQPSQFVARSDRAALALRQQLKQRGADIPESGGVEVGSDGRPPAPLPPEGSYARQAIERQRRLAQQRPSPQEATEEAPDVQMQPQDPQATLQGDPADGHQEGQPAGEDQVVISTKAQRRISQLTEDLRRKDQELQQLMEEAKASKSSLSELQSQMQALQQQHRQVLEQSLEHMDPDTRAQVLLDGRLAEAIAASEQRLMQQILPHLQMIDRQNIDAEMRRLASIYPRFEIDVHGPLIETFRKSNPRCTIEQAFRAVAEPEELQLGPQVRASAVPPAIKPGNGRVPSRWEDDRKNSDPERELVEEAQQLQKLMRSTDPNDKSRRDRFLHEHLAKRLGRSLPT